MITWLIKPKMPRIIPAHDNIKADVESFLEVDI